MADEAKARCRFVIAYQGRCGCEPVNERGVCSQHAAVTCQSCGSPATTQCSYTGQFVCGAPLCDDCEGWNDNTKPYGGWGFMNHEHRRRSPRHD